MDGVGAVILAAGASARLGRPKQLLMYEGETLIRRIVVAAGRCRPLVVVAGRDYQALADELQGTEARVLEHADWELGIGSSIRAGVAAALKAQADLGALILFVADQPHVTSEVVDALAVRWRETGCPIVASAYEETLGVPALFARSMFEELLALPNEAGAKQIIARSPGAVTAVRFPEGAIDIDTAMDVRQHLREGRIEAGEPLEMNAERQE